MSLWSESLSLCLYDSGDDPESRAKCILAHLSMEVPRSWWERALQSSTIGRSFARILRDLRNELLKVPGLDKNIELGLLVALAFVDDDKGKSKPRFGNVKSQYSIEEYLGKARKILMGRPELGQLGRLIDDIGKCST